MCFQKETSFNLPQTFVYFLQKRKNFVRVGGEVWFVHLAYGHNPEFRIALDSIIICLNEWKQMTMALLNKKAALHWKCQFVLIAFFPCLTLPKVQPLGNSSKQMANSLYRDVFKSVLESLWKACLELLA